MFILSQGVQSQSLPSGTCILAVLILMHPLWVFLGNEFAFPCDEYLVSKQFPQSVKTNCRSVTGKNKKQIFKTVFITFI